MLALFDLYRNEGYILTEHNGRFCVSISLFVAFLISYFSRVANERKLMNRLLLFVDLNVGMKTGGA